MYECETVYTVIIASIPSSTHGQMSRMTFGPQEMKIWKEPGILYHASDVEGNETVGRLRLCIGGQRCLPMGLCSWPDTHWCT